MNWQEERDATLRDARCVVVKVGTAVLSNGRDLNLDVLDNLVEQLSVLSGQGRRVVLVSSGAVGAGRTALRKLPGAPEAVGLSGKQAAAAVGQGRLMHLYDNAFSRRGLLTAQVLLTRDDLKSRTRFLNIRNTFSELLSWGVIPVVNENDTVSVNELKFSDNDNLSSLLVNPLEADLFVNLTSIGGVLDANPLENPEARIMPCIEDIRALNLDALCGGKSAEGTGGMYSKLLSAHRVAQLGVPTAILPGREADVITRLFAGETLGTWVRPERRTVSRRKYWLAYQADPQGTLVLDAGAADAVTARAFFPAASPTCRAALRPGLSCGWSLGTKPWAWGSATTTRRTCCASRGSSATRSRPFWAMPTIPRSSTGTTCCWMPHCKVIGRDAL